MPLSRLTLGLIFLGLILSSHPSANGQSDEAALERERAVADRFMQVLMRRPRPGTALDRIYGFHVQNDSLDELVSTLDVSDETEDAGKRIMILGLIQMQRGKPSLAAEAFTRAEKLLPDDAACSYYLGRAELAIGQTEAAAAAMERAIERGPARNEALPMFTELGRIYGRAGLNEKALAVWTKLESTFPGDARVGGQIARTLAEEGNVQEALDRYRSLAESARQDEDKIAFAVQAAEMRRRLGQTDEATKDLEQILSKLRPGSWLYTDVRNRIEDGFLKSGDYDALAEYYKKQLADSKDNLPLQIRLGRILVSAGRLDEAKETLESAAERAPDDANVRLALIDVLVSKADIAAAAAQFEKLAQQDPQNPDYLLRWGQILLEDQNQQVPARREAAAKVWKRLAETRTDDAVTLSQIADRLRSIERKEDAIALYQKAIEVDPQSPQYREYLGEYLHRLGRNDEAIDAWESIAAEDRRGRESLVRLAEVFKTFDLSDRALQAWSDAAEFDLSFPQELRYAKNLRDAKQFDVALRRLDIAESIAESPDEQEQLLKDRIETYQQAGTLAEQIAELRQQPPTATRLRQLAMMHQAAGQLTKAAEAIRDATEADPDSVDVLIVAADIAERQNRFGDAAELFEKLSSVDPRFRTNYLQRVADLQMRLGQIDEALLTCESLIDANPASVETYQFYARTAFRVGRDEQAITALRRAMNVAPRDNAPRRMLAASFAERYRTDEAIELYWQAMQYESKADDRISLVRQLAPLYDRKAEITSLIQRLEEIGREESDVRNTQLMIAAAHEAVQDYGAARAAIDRLVAQQPRDVSLLEAMVRLCDLADDVVLAAEYQERVVALADTPENRFKEVQLKLDADLIDVATAMSERISLASDTVRLGGMVRSATRRNDMKAAMAICREALRRDPSLWDLKLTLAQLLLLETGDEREKAYDEAIALTKEIRDAEFPLDAKPPCQKVTASTTTRRAPSAFYTSPMYWTNGNSTLARYHRLGRYGSYGYSFSTSSTVVEPRSFGHARALAASLQLVRIAKQKSGEELTDAIEQYIESNFGLPPIDEITDASKIWEDRAIKQFTNYLSTSRAPGPLAVSDEEQQRTEKINWRLAELDPVNGTSGLIAMLMSRVEKNVQRNVEKGSTDDTDESKKESLDPLTQPQLDLLVDLYEQAKARNNKQNQTQVNTRLLSYPTILVNEFQLAGKPELAAKYEMKPPSEDASFGEIFSTISFHLRLQRIEEADALVDRLMPSFRENMTSNDMLPTSSITGVAGTLSQNNAVGKEFVERHRLKLLDVFLARAIYQQTKARGRSSGPSDGTIRAYVQMGSGGYRSIQLKGPLSTDLLNQPIVSELGGVVPLETSNVSRTPKFKVPLEVIEHLEKPLEGVAVHENKTRRVLAAFAHWWSDRPQRCYEHLIELCEQYPDDVDLQIERARLANELKMPRVALDALDSFDPLDSRMLVRKEMAAMNLAAQLGDLERAKQSAERLFGMRMDTTTQLALVDQLRRLGMGEKAAAVLQRMRGGRARSESVELQIANAFLANDDKSSAAEVAYTLLRRLNSGRGRTSNVDSYRRQAVGILKSADRLDPLIAQAKRRLASSPSSSRVRAELADLYTAAGRSKDADKLWEDIADKSPNDPRQLMARAAALERAKKYREAGLMYLDAFEKQPQLFNNNFYQMTRAMDRAKATDEMFDRLLKFSPDAIPSFRIDSLLRSGGSSNFSDSKIKFIRHVLKSSYATSNFYRFVDRIPVADRSKIPEIREVMIKAACSSDAFSPTSSLWNAISYSSGGTARGPLKGIVDLINSDSDVQQRFRVAAEKARSVEEQKPSADFLLALIDVVGDRQRSESVENLREQMKSIRDADLPANGRPAVNGRLLWQAGQILETIDGIDQRPSLLVAMYEVADADPQVSSMDFQYTVAYRLIDVYAKNNQQAKARQFLLEAYESTDFSEQNQYNPGYGDYQDLNAYQGIAGKLVNIDFPLDALTIYRRALADPARFERAKQLGGSRSMRDAFEKAEKAAIEKITPAVSANHLETLCDALSDEKLLDGEKPQAIDLLDIPIAALGPDQGKSTLPMAIESAMTTDEGNESIQRLASTLAETSAKRSEDWSLPGAQILVAAMTQPDQVPKLVEALRERLPQTEEIEASAGTPQASKFRALFDLYTPASAAIQSDDEACQESGRTLVAYLKTVGSAVQEPQFAVAIAALTGDRTESLATYLDSIASAVKPGVPLSDQQTKTCLGIAKSAAEAGDIALSTRALKQALGNGPPLRQLSTSGDAFSISRSRSSMPNRQGDTAMEELVRDVNEIIDIYSDATGVQLGQKSPKALPEGVDETEIDASLNEIFPALEAIVLPEPRKGLVFPYAKAIVSTTSYDRINTSAKISPVSVARALGRAAAEAGQSEGLIDRLKERLASSADKATAAGVMIDVAYAANDADSLREAIREFAAALDASSSLPKADANTGIRTDAPMSITSQMQQDSFRKSETVNLVMRCIWPLLEQSDFPPKEVRAEAQNLLARTIALINSDTYTANRHRSVAEIIRRRMMKAAASADDQSSFEKLLKMDVDAVRQRYATYTGDQREEIIARSLEGLLNRMLNDGFGNRATKFVRELIASQDEGRRNYRSTTPVMLCANIAELPASQQFEMLSKITLGENEEDPIAFWGGLVRYSTPPPQVRDQVELFDQIDALSTLDESMPLASTLLLFAKVAAELGKSDEVATAIAARSQVDGDRADIAATLIRLAGQIDVHAPDVTDAQRSDVLQSLEMILAAVAHDLAENKPTKTDKSVKFPELECILVTRAIQLGLQPERAQPLLQDLKAYAIRGEYNMMVSGIGRLTARAGIGRAGGGTVESPLQHFVPISFPSRYEPDVTSLKPLYAVNDKGWVSGTGGYNISMLMLRYPITGSFTLSANIRDGNWGEADVSYGGVLYQATGFNQTATVGTLGSQKVEFPVASIKKGKENVEALRVAPEETVALCNDQPYVTDIAAGSFPWMSISHQMFRTTQFRDIKITGNATIPRIVNLIDPTMRGWEHLVPGWPLPDPLLPIGPKQNAKEIAENRRKAAATEESRWRVSDGELIFKSPTSPQAYDRPGHIQYARPLLDGETIESSVWWQWNSHEVYPSVGRTYLRMTPNGVLPTWVLLPNDVTNQAQTITYGYVNPDEEESKDLDEPEKHLASDNVPINKAWNLFRMSRRGNEVIVELNDKPLVNLPVTEPARPGLMRPISREVRIRSIELKGDWPKEVPAELMQLVSRQTEAE